MYEEAQRIFDYLPIRSVPLEQEYIQYLWETFSVLDNTETSTRSFSIMPFHLLFMMAIQYKVIKISEHNQKYYKNFIEKNKNLEKESINILLSQKKSVFDISSIRERSIGDLFNSITQDNIIIKDYLDSLDKIQSVYLYMNIDIANRILDEIKEYEYLDMDVIFERNMLDDNITPKDLGVIISCILNSEEEFIFFEQLEYLVNKGLEFSYQDTISALKIRVLDEFDDDKRLYLIRTLVENNEIDESLKKKILIRSVKRDYEKEIIELLNT